MKKLYILLFTSVFVLSGCTVGQGLKTAKGLNEIQDEYPEVVDEVKEEIIEIITEEVVNQKDEIKEDVEQLINEEIKEKNNMEEKKEEVKIEKALVEQFSGAIIKTTLGSIEVKFYGEDSPKTVENFMKLAQSDFYNGTLFHRVISDFMIQGGDPNSKNENWATHGTGGPGYKFNDEFNAHKLVRGSLAMANSGPNTNGSQFFIVTASDTPWLDGKHTNFGYVVGGMEIVEKIEVVEKNQNDHPMKDIMITSIELVK